MQKCDQNEFQHTIVGESVRGVNIYDHTYIMIITNEKGKSKEKNILIKNLFMIFGTWTWNYMELHNIDRNKRKFENTSTHT